MTFSSGLSDCVILGAGPNPILIRPQSKTKINYIKSISRPCQRTKKNMRHEGGSLTSIIRAFETIAMSLINLMEDLEINGPINHIQYIALIRLARIQRKDLES